MSLLCLRVRCPRCNRAPNRRIFPRTVSLYAPVDPAEPVDSHKCTGCGEVYVITAAAYHVNIDVRLAT